MFILLVAVGALVWSGVSLLLHAWLRRRSQPDLLERLLPYQPVTVADEAQAWLNKQ